MRYGAVALAALLGAAGCAGFGERPLRVLTPTDAAPSLDKRSPYLKAHMRDGQAYVLAEWSVDEAAQKVSGRGQRLGPDRRVLEDGTFTVAIDSVALFETNVVQRSPSLTALSVVTGLSVAVTGYCQLNTKACFGSCPTFYVSDGEEPVLQAEGFSGSVLPSLEARDVDALYRARPAGRDLDVRMTNEALETHVVRYVHILAAPRPPGGRVFATEDGEFWRAATLREPLSCVAAEGDCRAAVRDFDGRERGSATDGEDLAAREVIDVDFGRVGEGTFGLVVGSRQTFLSTYLFYQALAYMGGTVVDDLARVERGGRIRGAARGLSRALGAIEILVPRRSGWRRIGEIGETGPLAADVKMIRLPSFGRSPARVRLRLTRGHWRLDFVALARLTGRVEPVRLLPSAVRAAGAPGAAGTPAPAGTLTTLPGDAYTSAFRLPEGPDGYELFLESRGYYLEWIRYEWVREENPARAALMFRRPKQALRELAPEFKGYEAGMEDVFWRSRYAPPQPR